MKAVRAVSGQVAVVDVDEPSGDGVLVQVRSTGICGSDLHLVDFGLPATLGHEFAGVLEDGTAVAVQPVVGCGACDQCGAGRDHLCRSGPGRTLGVGLDGGLAERVLVDPRSLVRLGASVDIADAALVEPLAVAVHAVNKGGIGAGDRVLVVGAGSIGLLSAAAAAGAGATVHVAARHDRQREAAAALGFDAAPEGEYDAVIDAAGSQSSFDAAVEHVRPGGTVVVVATWWAPVQVGTGLLMKEAVLVPAYTYGHHAGTREFEQSAALLAARPELGPTVVSHRFPLADAAEAFRVAGDRAAGAIKVVLEP